MHLKKYLAELIGSFSLVFCGTGSIIIDQQTQGMLGQTGIAACFGLIVLAMIFTFGERSGAHFNPAVSISFAAVKRFNIHQIIPYTLSQLSGALLASGLLRFLFPDNVQLGATHPSGSPLQSFIMEWILSYILMLVIIHVSQGSKESGILAGIAIGATVGLEALFGGPVSGASMNPARSIAPAMVTGNYEHLWIYILAPIFGMLAASFTWNYLNGSPIPNPKNNQDKLLIPK